MHKAARQRHLLDLLSERGQAAVAELAGAIGVSVDTVRRDLADLERQGLAQKHHGGAIALEPSDMPRRRVRRCCRRSSSGSAARWPRRSHPAAP